MSEPRFGLRTALFIIALVGVAAGVFYAHDDRSDDGQIWLLPYESGR